MATIKQLLADGAHALVDSESENDSARLDAEILLALTLQKPRTWLYTWPEHIPSLPEQHMYLDLLRRRQSGEPVAYLTHRREFFVLELKINHHVLVPRPETETLVQCVLDVLADNSAARIADLGTGSGAVALALASQKPQARIVATDASSDALALARENAERLGIDNVTFMAGDWLVPLSGLTFDLIASNPPYIAEDDPHLSRDGVRFEPKPALVSGKDGLDAIRQLVTESPACLEIGGWLMIEHGFDQGEAVRGLFTEVGFIDVVTHRDLGGNERVTIGKTIKR